MYKKVIPLILTFVLICAPLMGGAGTVRAAAADDLETIIAAQYDAFARSLNPEGASEAVSRLVKHSIKNGGTLNMGATDKFSRGLLNSEMFRASIIHASTVALEKMLAINESKIFMRGTFGWYDHNMRYGSGIYIDNENGNDADDKPYSPYTSASQNPYTGPTSSYDDGMTLVVGEATSRYTFRKISVTKESITIKVSVKVYDRFDFRGADYDADAELAETLTWLGRLLSLGLLYEFNWTVTAEFELTIPNTCTHESGSYNWEFNGSDLVTLPSGYMISNPLRKTDGTTENGVFTKTSYIISTPIRLYHDRPWVLEIQCAGDGMFAFSGTYGAGNSVYLRKAANTVFFGESVYLNESDEKTTLTHYGVYFTKHISISVKDTHTYLLTNHVFEDGSNMVYLSIDGIDLGPMHHYYHVGTSQNATIDWVNGKDFTFECIGKGMNVIHNLAIDHIRVWENGMDQPPFSHTNDSVKPASCTVAGSVSRACKLCGAMFSESIPMVPHEPVAIPGAAPTCTESGLTDGSICKTCNTVLVEQTVLDPRGHSFQDRICTLCGEQEYVPGDVDLDDDVDVDDVLALLWNVLFPEDYPIEVDADFDHNGSTDVDDVLTLLWFVLFPEDYPLN